MSAFLPFDVALLAAPLIDPWRLRLAACAAAGLLALAIAFVMIRMIWRIHWRGPTARHYVHLRNRGNLMSALALGAYAPAHNLQFKYLLDGETLAVRKSVPAAAPAPDPRASAPGPEQASQAPAAAPSAVPQPTKTAGQQAAQAAASAQEKAEKVSGISALIIDIVGTLGSILPGALGQSLKDRSVQLQAKKSAIKARGQAPMRAVKQAQHLKDSVGDLKDEVGPAGQSAAPVPAARQTAPIPSPAAQAPAPQAAALPAVQAAAPSLPCPEYVQLPALAPEASLRLEMRVSPANPYFKGESCYWLFTLPQGDPSRLPPEALEAHKEVKEVTFGGLSVYYWLLTLLLSAAAVLVNGAWYYFFVRWIAYTFA